MRSYDLIIVLRPSLMDTERSKLIDVIKGYLKDVKFTKEEEWGKKPLAYVIKKEVAGYYYFFKFESEASIPAGFEQKLLVNEGILRHLLLRIK